MSTFDDASLVLIPSGYKASKVYSVKPTDGTGDLTFTRSLDTATRVGPDGLIEKVRTNLLTFSEDWANAAWTKNNATVTSNATPNPINGALTADLVTATASVGFISSAAFALPALPITISMFAKKSNVDFVSIEVTDSIANSSKSWYNIANGTLGTTGGIFTITGRTITDAGNGFYRLTLTFVCSVAANYLFVPFYVATDGALSVSGNAGFGFGAQVEVSDFGATPYIATTTAAVSVGMLANVPRLDYYDTTCPNLLLEPQRTNLLNFSENFDNAYWFKDNGTITPNDTISPDGFQNADAFIENTANAGHIIIGPAYIPSGTHTISVFVKPNGRNRVAIGSASGATATAVFELIGAGIVVRASEGHITNGKIESYPNGWYRVSCVSTIGSASSLGFFLVNVATNKTYLGDGISGMFFYGNQLEAGSYPTSYIPTLAAAVTRSADAAFKTGISSLLNSTEGTLFVEVERIGQSGDAAENLIFISDTSTNNFVNIVFNISTSRYRAQVREGGVTTGLVNATAAYTGSIKIAMAYAANDLVLYINGEQQGIDTSVTIPSAAFNSLGLGGVFDGTYFDTFRGNYKQTLLFTTRLSNAALAELTA